MTQSITYSNFKVYLDNQGVETNRYVQKINNARYIFTLPQPVLLSPTDEHRIVVGVESASIPLSFYAVNDTNNKLKMSTNIAGPFVDITLTEGNYDVASFLTELNTRIQAHYSHITATYNSISSKITFTTTGDPFAFNVVSSKDSAKRLIGLTEGNTYHTSSYVCEDTINLTYTTGVTIRANNIQTINQDTSFDSAGASSLLRIPINTAPNTVLTHFNPQPFLTTISSKTLTYLDIGLYDDNQRLLRIKDHAWFIVMRVDFVLSTDYFLDRTKIQAMREEAENAESTPDEERDEETIQVNPLRHGIENTVLQEYVIPEPEEEEE